MISDVKAVLKLAAAALLSFAAAPLYANGAPYVPPAQILGFTEANQTPPFITSKDMTRGAASDGSLTFSLDMFFGTNTPNSFAISPMIQYDSAKLDIIEIANVAHAGFFKPEPSRVNDRKFKIADWSRKPAFAGADTEFLLVWMDLNEITAVSGATTENPVRIATIKFQWKAGAVGASQIAIIEGDAGVSDENFRGVSVDIQGVEVAEATEDDDMVAPSAAGIWVSKTHISTTEGEGGEAKFQVRLTVQPPTGENVVLSVTSSDPKDVAVSPASLTFTAKNWNAEQEVTVSSVDDEYAENYEQYTIDLAVDNKTIGADHPYHDKTASVLGLNADNDAAVVLSVDPVCLFEEKDTHTVTLTATLRGLEPAGSDMLLTFGQTDGTAVKDTDYKMLGVPGADVAGHNSLIIPKGEISASTNFSITLNAITERKTLRLGGSISASGPSVTPAELIIRQYDLDVDESGDATPQDGILIMRYLMGVHGEALIAGQSAAKHSEVAEYIADCSYVWNVHVGKSKEEAKAPDWLDGLLITRYLLGLRGENLKGDDNEIDPEEVADNIGALLPPE